MGLLGNGASLDTLMRRARYGGRKGRSACRRLDGLTLGHPSGARITFRVVRGALASTSFGTMSYSLVEEGSAGER